MRSPVPRATPSSRLRVAGAGWGEIQSDATRPVPSSSTESATSTARRPRLVVTWAISSPRRGTSAARSILTPSPPGTEMPSSSGTVSGPACDQSTTSPTARPALGLTSSMTELWVAPEPRPVNHCSAVGGRQSVAVNGVAPDRPATRPGASASTPVTTTGSLVATTGRLGRRLHLRDLERLDLNGTHVVAEPRDHLAGRLGERRDPDEHVRADRGRADHGRGGQGGELGLVAYVVAPVALGRVGDQERGDADHRQGHGQRQVGAEPAHRRLLTLGAHSTRTATTARAWTSEQGDPQPRARPVQRRRGQRPVDLPGPGVPVLGARRDQAAGGVQRGRDVGVGGRRQHDVLDARPRPGPSPPRASGARPGRPPGRRSPGRRRCAPRSRPHRAGCRPRAARCSAGRPRRCRGPRGCRARARARSSGPCRRGCPGPGARRARAGRR